MTFNWAIDAGQVILFISFVFTILTMHKANIERLKTIEIKVDIIYGWFKNKVLRQRIDEE